MTIFTYEALSQDGKDKKGVIDADSAKSARSLLRTQGLIPLNVYLSSTRQTSQGATTQSLPALFTKKVFNATALSIWTRQLAGLVSSGLPLERALASLSEEAERPQERQLVATLRSEVNAGSTFAKALEMHPREFEPIFTAVIGAGEQSGHLGTVLEKLADDLEDQHQLRTKLMGAALYPAIVSVIAIVIVIFLITYVVPQVANVFAGSKKALPWITTAMIGTSDFLRAYGVYLLGLIGVGTFILHTSLKSPAFRLKYDAVWLNIPIIGRLSRSYNAARFASTLAMLCAAGVPILKSLHAAADTLSNKAMQKDAMDALVLVREGATLASALHNKKRFPGLLAMFSRLGEQTGQLPTMLARAAKQLSTEVSRRAMQLATLLEPLLIVGMGIVVMLIVLAVLMPIIQLNQLVH